MEAKQNAIRAAYGNQWDLVRHYVDSDGWLDTYLYKVRYAIECDVDEPRGCERPIALRGIEENNGWIRCDERLPNPTVAKHRYCIDGVYRGVTNGLSVVNTYNAYLEDPAAYQNVTHWKPVEEIKPPIY